MVNKIFLSLSFMSIEIGFFFLFFPFLKENFIQLDHNSTNNAIVTRYISTQYQDLSRNSIKQQNLIK